MKLAQTVDTAQISRDGLIDRSVQVDFQALGVNYVASSRAQAAPSLRFVDKLPANYLYCGPIHLALPGARIIVLARGAMDSCLAMLSDFIRKPVSLQVESVYNQEQFDIVLM